MYLVKTPAFIKKIYSDLIWDFGTESNDVYLSFDDGPVPESTPWVLDILKKYDAKATFFCIGENVVKNPEIYSRIQQEGHRIANHTHTHISGWKTKNDVYLDDIELAANHIDSKLFRPPYGRIKPSQIKSLLKRYTIVMWDVVSGDFDERLSANDCYENVTKNTQAGSVVVFHDSIKAKPRLHACLEKIIVHLKEQGYTFKTIP